MYCGSFPAWAVPRSVRRGPLQGPQCRRKSSSAGSLFLCLRPFFQWTVGISGGNLSAGGCANKSLQTAEWSPPPPVAEA
ncbi:hypothetical protein CTAM01_03863 [Colletotrichum tamarilloi]|uniref:Uncharacterized protein n=1 Tax=Colletotrichum tamarilloi TaxID=1209934 RepID=A0ABQ9RJ23_9PEZI|nr:uncharacterized protein CTAM01_03863 [Colletotrichum tamarilloi]KAK1504556.1 hypothetical protein CTAM01_03863 [Colletotrichum tamarilloi]